MNPNDNKNPQIVPHPSQVTPLREAPKLVSPQREAAANVVRTQLDAIYDKNQVSTDDLAAESPYARTHTPAHDIAADEWKAYHSAWQNYYQQYYQGYYEQELAKTKASQVVPQPVTQAAQPQSDYFSQQPALPEREAPQASTISRDDALLDLRRSLLQSVRARAAKVRHSRHFIPIIAAAFVMLIFVFLQYNAVIVGAVAAYVSPGAIDPNNVVVDPSSAGAVGSDPKLIIPKINVDVPVAYGIGNDYDSQMAAMTKGVANFAIPGADSHPGQYGNTVIAGHSSNDLFDKGDYKFIFAQLSDLKVGDSIYADYNGVRYTYIVSKTAVVAPTDVGALQIGEDKPSLTLITCTPLGTAISRLLVFADQVSPDPSTDAPAPDQSGQQTSTATSIPGESPSVLQKLFGAKG